MSDSNDWVKLRKVSDWGNLYYAEGHRPSMNKRSDSVIHAFDQIEIRWPDGMREIVNVTTKSFNERVSDHGHSYNVHSILPVIVANHHGIEILIEFDKVEIHRRCLTGPGLFDPDPDDDDDPERMCA